MVNIDVHLFLLKLVQIYRPALLYFNPGCNSNFSYNSASRTLNCTNKVGMLNFIPIGTIAVGKGYVYSS